ncbi:MAG: hypothetical protein HC767_05990 [Akkermansiaceae bacterium]|nr:hypothetical protein [Akkermansiaceae bacterium]
MKTLGDTLKGMKTIEEKQAELFGIWSQLAKVLKMFHQRGWYLRDVTYDNVVHVRMGATEGWTLLEFGNASRPKSSIAKNTIPPRQCPPEVCRLQLPCRTDVCEHCLFRFDAVLVPFGFPPAVSAGCLSFVPCQSTRRY